MTGLVLVSYQLVSYKKQCMRIMMASKGRLHGCDQKGEYLIYVSFEEGLAILLKSIWLEINSNACR